MKTKLLEYKLPPQLIADKPAAPRDNSRLMVIDRKTEKISHHKFKEITKFFKKGDVLVLNKTKVFPARLVVQKDTGGKIEILFLEEESKKIWQVLTKPGLKIGQKATKDNLEIICLEHKDNITKVKINLAKQKLMNFLEKFGQTPLPPYIKTKEKESTIKKNYQTIYAQKTGSVAAPTAGFHFTKKLIEKIKRKGVKIKYITLHIGIATFAPIKTDRIENHKMHYEFFEISKNTAKSIFSAKSKGKRIIAVGTTSVRALETIAGSKEKTSGKTNLFIYPPYEFKLTDCLITNFHLPRSTLLAMVSAFVSYPQTKKKFKSFEKSLIGKAYKEAIKNGYRFYSFGDACLII